MKLALHFVSYVLQRTRVWEWKSILHVLSLSYELNMFASSSSSSSPSYSTSPFHVLPSGLFSTWNNLELGTFSLVGRSSRTGEWSCYRTIAEHKQRRYSDIHVSTGIQTHDLCVRAEAISCLGPRGHCNRLFYIRVPENAEKSQPCKISGLYGGNSF
jgi:hypothetical protein